MMDNDVTIAVSIGNIEKYSLVIAVGVLWQPKLTFIEFSEHISIW